MSLKIIDTNGYSSKIRKFQVVQPFDFQRKLDFPVFHIIHYLPNHLTV